MDVQDVARRWARTWERAWREKDVEAIVALYARDAVYRALPLRAPDLGVDGVRRYLEENFAVEEGVECRFSEPVAAGERAAVEWWASWVEGGRELTMTGTTMLRFGSDGLVVDHRDYWNERDGIHPPYDRW